MADVLSDLITKISLDASDFTAGLDKVLTGSASLTTVMERISSTIFSPAGAVGAIAAVGTAAFTTAQTFDEAMDRITVATGATGEILDGLEKSFTNVYSKVPASAETVATAIGEINTRLGLSGEPLEKLSVQFVNLARITGTDVTSAITSATQAFTKWDVKDTSTALDTLFAVTQKTGISFTELSSTVTTFAAPLQAMGLGFSEAAALAGVLEQSGVNTEQALGGLRLALGKLSSAGVEDVSQGLQSIIEGIANAGSAGEANALAIEAFGSRAGPELAAAIQEGRFELGALLADLEASSTTINSTAAATDDFGQVWATTWHNIQILLEPIGKALLFLLNNLAVSIQTIVGWIGKLYDGFVKIVQPVVNWTKGLFASDEELKKQAGDLSKMKAAMDTVTASIETHRASVDKSASSNAALTTEYGKQKSSLDGVFSKIGKHTAATDKQTLSTAAMHMETSAMQLAQKALGMQWEQDYKTLDVLTTGLENQKIAMQYARTSVIDVTQSMREFDAQVDALVTSISNTEPAANTMSAALTRTLAAAGPQFETFKTTAETKLTETEGKFGTFSTNVNMSISGLSSTLVTSLWEDPRSWGKQTLGKLTDLGKAVVTEFTAPFENALNTLVSGAISNFLGPSGLGGISSSISGLFGQTAGAAVPSAPGAASAPGAGAAASSAGGWLGALGSIGSIASGVSGILGLFGVGGNGKDLGRIEENTRYTMLYLGPPFEYGVTGYTRRTYEAVLGVIDALTWGNIVHVLADISDNMWNLDTVHIPVKLDALNTTATDILSELRTRPASITVNIQAPPGASERSIADAVMAQLRLQMGVA